MHKGDSVPWIDCFHDHYGWSALRDLGDLSWLDTIIWKDIITGLTHFRSVSKSIIGDAKTTYDLSFLGLPDDPFAKPIWDNQAQVKCKIFLWTTHKRRIFTNERRAQRGLAASARCPFCSSDEDVEHLFLRCAEVATIWHTFDLDEQQIASLPQLEGVWDIPPPGQPATPRVWRTIMLAVMWNIWKGRNNKVFNSVDEPATLVLRCCASDIDLWSHRCKNAESKQQLRNWASYLSVINS
ncbi:hypothetical protein [Oryza sativa Japonica Group]|uniref:Reverse transcriptase zinc-binding domain-containing protein n=1 Tax=Oryza sativa subsp. japonica TaxID=39947 RepID=Q8S126_ORYSJ|nr:hypothetical protein [Oryza sativa Japonica Group]